MKMEKIREMTDEELSQSLHDLKEELFNLRFQISTGQAGNPLRMRQVRRDIARINTLIRENELKTAAKGS